MESYFMIRITRLTDYGIVLLTHIAKSSDVSVHNIRDLSAETRLPLPTVSKILKALTRKGILISHRGVKGGVKLARKPENITVVDIICALDGPIAITDCTSDNHHLCDKEGLCSVKSNWQKINRAVQDTLQNITLADMARDSTHQLEPVMLSQYIPLQGD
jgi:FeS assembly SUF system regulator